MIGLGLYALPFWLLLAVPWYFIRGKWLLAITFAIIHFAISVAIVVWALSGSDVEPWMRMLVLVGIDIPLLPIIWPLDPDMDLIPLALPVLGTAFYGTIGWYIARPERGETLRSDAKENSGQ